MGVVRPCFSVVLRASRTRRTSGSVLADFSHVQVTCSPTESFIDERHTSGVTASGGGVSQGQTDLLGGVDDEDGADGQSQTLGVDVGGVLVVDHVVEVGNLALGVGDDGELQVGAGNLIDILDPAVVALSVVGTQTDKLGVASSELRLKLGEGTELGGTDLKALSVNAQCNLH